MSALDFGTIKATLEGSRMCSAEGISVTADAPVLALCRQLVATGLDPQLPLEAYRGETLSLWVRSIGEAAELDVAGNGIGFRRRRDVVGAPPIAPDHLGLLAEPSLS
jgi:hypothetical protein